MLRGACRAGRACLQHLLLAGRSASAPSAACLPPPHTSTHSPPAPPPSLAQAVPDVDAVEIAELLLPVLAGDAAAVATRDTNVVAYGPGLLEAVGRLRKVRGGWEGRARGLCKGGATRACRGVHTRKFQGEGSAERSGEGRGEGERGLQINQRKKGQPSGSPTCLPQPYALLPAPNAPASQPFRRPLPLGRCLQERRPEHAEALRSVDAMLAAAPHSANQAQALLDGLKTGESCCFGEQVLAGCLLGGVHAWRYSAPAHSPHSHGTLGECLQSP